MGKITYDETTGEVFINPVPISGDKHAIFYEAESPENIADFAGTYYLDLSGDPDLSGNKVIRWKMWIDSASSSGTVFSLGENQDSIGVIGNGSGELRCTNINRTMGNDGEKRLDTTGLYGMVLDCLAIKTSNEITWFQIGGKTASDQYLSQTGTALDISRIGGSGVDSSPGTANDIYVWNIEVDGIGSWNGYGNDADTDAAWADGIGSNDGSWNGTPTLVEKTSTPTYTDWFMPSKDELDAMYDNLKSAGDVGGFGTGVYWSSSETSTTQGWAQSFNNGAQLGTITKTSDYFTRAARKFTAGIGAYSMQDTGPAGGWIFYIDGGGTTYYECAPFDNTSGENQIIGNKWSNITAASSGATGTAIGTGSTNTPLITGQSGHEYSLADVCEKFAVL